MRGTGGGGLHSSRARARALELALPGSLCHAVGCPAPVLGCRGHLFPHTLGGGSSLSRVPAMDPLSGAAVSRSSLSQKNRAQSLACRTGSAARGAATSAGSGGAVETAGAFCGSAAEPGGQSPPRAPGSRRWMRRGDIDQLKRIMEVVGTPSSELLKKISSEHARKYIESLPHMPQQDLKAVFRGANPLAVELLEKMLILDSDKRITAAEALAHPYFVQYHDPDDEPEAELYDESIENKERNIDEWKELTYEEVNSFKPPDLKLDSLEIEQ